MEAQVAGEHFFKVVSSLQSKRGGLLRSFWPTPWHIPCDLPSNKYVLAEKYKKSVFYRLGMATIPVKPFSYSPTICEFLKKGNPWYNEPMTYFSISNSATPPYNDLQDYNVIFIGWQPVYKSISFRFRFDDQYFRAFIVIIYYLSFPRTSQDNDLRDKMSLLYNKQPFKNHFSNKKKIFVGTERINFITSGLHCYVSENSPLTVWMKKTSKFLASGLRSFVLKQKKT